MKKLLILLFFYITLNLSGATYYISPSGSDSNPGSISQPFFTLNKAWSVVSAGDIIYMRGGTYRYNSTQSLTNKNGTSGSPINILNYPGENPVFDYSTGTTMYIGLYLRSADYIHIKGLRVTNVVQPANPTSGVYGMILWDDVDYSTFEMVEVDHIEGTGVGNAGSSSNNTYLNCDSHHNADPHPGGDGNPYGGADGFWSASTSATNIVFKGCRSWYNSDDGWDIRRANGVYTIDNCWSFRNGFIPGTSTAAGNGDGYKLGGKTAPSTNSILRTVKNSLAFENRATGFTPEPDAAENILGLDLYNCTSYKNARDLGEGINTGNYNNYTRVRNCISYANYGTNAWMQSGSVHDHNSWDISKTVSDADFASLNSSGVDGPRQSDGSLPNLAFLHLAAGSGLIDMGTNTGQSYTSSAPDLGAYEQTGSSTTPPATTAPVLLSSIIDNTTPAILQLNYDLSLSSSIIPAVASFSVMVNAVARTVSSVTISGTKVQLNLGTAAKYGDVILVTYTKPSTSPLQTTAGGFAASVSSKAVTNNIAAATKDGSPVNITMDISPNHVHRVINVLLGYSSSPTATGALATPETINIYDSAGKLFLEKTLTLGATSFKIALNLKSGIYIVKILSGGFEKVAQRIIVY